MSDVPAPCVLELRAARSVDAFLRDSEDEEIVSLRALLGVVAGRLAHMDAAGALIALSNVRAALKRSIGAAH